MIKTNRFMNLVEFAFAGSCRKFALRIRNITDKEVAIQGADFVLLAWLDRDGVSVKYVDVASNNSLVAIDLGSFLATKRIWMVDDFVSVSKEFESKIQRELLSFARTLELAAPDILEGQRGWLSDVTDPPLVLSGKHE